MWPNHFRYDQVIEAADASLRRLGVDHVDLYLLHWHNPDVPIGETMSAMDRLVADGKTRYVGVSNFSVAQLEEARSVSENPIVTNQVKYSLTARDIEAELLPHCQRNGITITAYSPVNSVLREATPSLKSALKRVAKDAGEDGGAGRAELVHGAGGRHHPVALQLAGTHHRELRRLRLASVVRPDSRAGVRVAAEWSTAVRGSAS